MIHYLYSFVFIKNIILWASLHLFMPHMPPAITWTFKVACVWVLWYMLRAVFSVHPSGSAEPTKPCIKKMDIAIVHRAVWCFVHPHTVAWCSPKLSPHYLHYPTSSEQDIFSLGFLVLFVCSTIGRVCFTFSFSI